MALCWGWVKAWTAKPPRRMNRACWENGGTATTVSRRRKGLAAHLALDVVTITKATKLFLPGGVPDVEHDRAVVCVELKRVDIDTECGCGGSGGGRLNATKKKGC